MSDSQDLKIVPRPTAEDMARDILAEYEELEGDLYRDDGGEQLHWACALRRARHAEAEVREFIRLAHAIANATDDAAHAQAVHEIVQQARGNGWTDVPEPVILLALKRAEEAEAASEEAAKILRRLANALEGRDDVYAVACAAVSHLAEAEEAGDGPDERGA